MTRPAATQPPEVRQVLERGYVASIRSATADVGWRMGPDAAARSFDPAHGGMRDSPPLSLDDTISAMPAIDAVRHRWRVRIGAPPGEEAT
jgi:hypothetical protein